MREGEDSEGVHTGLEGHQFGMGWVYEPQKEGEERTGGWENVERA